jgi:hypothetical protein
MRRYDLERLDGTTVLGDATVEEVLCAYFERLILLRQIEGDAPEPCSVERARVRLRRAVRLTKRLERLVKLSHSIQLEVQERSADGAIVTTPLEVLRMLEILVRHIVETWVFFENDPAHLSPAELRAAVSDAETAAIAESHVLGSTDGDACSRLRRLDHERLRREMASFNGWVRGQHRDADTIALTQLCYFAEALLGKSRAPELAAYLWSRFRGEPISRAHVSKQRSKADRQREELHRRLLRLEAASVPDSTVVSPISPK